MGYQHLKRHFVRDWGWENLEDRVLPLGRKRDIGNAWHRLCRRAPPPAWPVQNKPSAWRRPSPSLVSFRAGEADERWRTAGRSTEGSGGAQGERHAGDPTPSRTRAPKPPSSWGLQLTQNRPPSDLTARTTLDKYLYNFPLVWYQLTHPGTRIDSIPSVGSQRGNPELQLDLPEERRQAGQGTHFDSLSIFMSR